MKAFERIILVPIVLVLSACESKLQVKVNSKLSSLKWEVKQDSHDGVLYTKKVSPDHHRTLIILERDGMSAEKSQEMWLDKTAQIRGLFGAQVASYHSMLTKSTSCLTINRLRTEKVNFKNGFYAFSDLRATEQLLFGSCSEDLDVYKSQLLFLYCEPLKKFYEVRYFFPKSEPYLTEPVLSCE